MQSLEFRKPIYPDNKQIETVANGLKESLTTFKVIKLAAKNNFLEVLAEFVHKIYAEKEPFLFLGKPNTECNKTVLGLSAIFSEAKISARAFKYLTKPYPKYSKAFTKLDYDIHLLFDGIIIRFINKRSDYESLSTDEASKLITQALNPHIKSYKNYIRTRKTELESADGGPRVEHAYQIIYTLDYPINQTILDDFKSTLAENSSKISDNTSFVYYVGIAFPHLSFYAWVHIFAVEQFKQDKTLYRIHQSWVNQFTLLDNPKKGNNEEEENCLIEEEFQTFLTKLTDFCCTKDRKKVSNSECFGATPSYFPLFHIDEGVLSGLSVRWWAEPFNPKESAKHFSNFCMYNFIRK